MKQDILCVIPARSGSKGIKKKNIRELAGKPLIAHSIESALDSEYLDNNDVICSTDSEKIARIARDYGAKTPFLRPEEYATDEAKSISVAKHALDWAKENREKEYDILLFLQPTSPLRQTIHIDEAIESMASEDSSVVSVKEPEDMPYNMKKIEGVYLKDLMEESYHRRQDMPEVFAINGAIYLTRIETIIEEESFYGEKCKPYKMSRKHSIDIDEPIDLKKAKFLMDEIT